MQRFTFDDEDDSIKDTKRENSIQQEEKEPEVKKVVKTKVKHKRSHSLPKRTKTKVKYKEKSHPNVAPVSRTLNKKVLKIN